MQRTTRDVSGIALPPNVRWGSSLTVCPHCGRPSPMPEALLGGRWVPFVPYPCDCPQSARFRERAEEDEARRRVKVPSRFEGNGAGSFADVIRSGRGVYLHGPVGTGKTASAYATAEELSAEGWRVEVTSLGKLRSELDDTWGTSETQAALFGRLAGCDLLVLDDLGKEAPTEATVSMLYRVVNDRYERRRAVMATSNYPRARLAERIRRGTDAETATAIASRLIEMTESVEMGGEDRRLKC